MKLKGKHTSKFNALIAGIIIIAHTVIPHHHHFTPIEVHSENLECITTHTDKHNEASDVHCHAFNLIVSDSHNNLKIHSGSISKFYPNFLGVNTSLEFISKHKVANYVHYSAFCPHKQVFLTNHSLRAPPITV